MHGHVSVQPAVPGPRQGLSHVRAAPVEAHGRMKQLVTTRTGQLTAVSKTVDEHGSIIDLICEARLLVAHAEEALFDLPRISSVVGPALFIAY